MELESIKAILGSRVQITEPGKFKVKVTSVSPYEDRNICNFNAMTPYHVAQTKADIASGDLDACKNHNLSSGQRMGKDFTPAKGDFVNIHVDYITTKDGEQALLVTGVEEIKAAATARLNVDSFFGDDEESADLNAGLETKANAKAQSY